MTCQWKPIVCYASIGPSDHTTHVVEQSLSLPNFIFPRTDFRFDRLYQKRSKTVSTKIYQRSSYLWHLNSYLQYIRQHLKSTETVSAQRCKVATLCCDLRYRGQEMIPEIISQPGLRIRSDPMILLGSGSGDFAWIRIRFLNFSGSGSKTFG